MSELRNAFELVNSLTGAILAAAEQAESFGVSPPVGAVVCRFNGPVDRLRERLSVFAQVDGVAWLGITSLADLPALAREFNGETMAAAIESRSFKPQQYPVFFLGPEKERGAFVIGDDPGPVSPELLVRYGSNMPEPKPVEFTFTAGPAGVVHAKTAAGLEYEIRVGVAVFAVTDTGVVNAEGIPVLEVRAGISLDTKRAQS